MTRTSKPIAVPPNFTCEETTTQELSSGGFASEQLKQGTTTLLSGTEPLQGLKPKERRSFHPVDKVDQVCRQPRRPILLSKSSVISTKVYPTTIHDSQNAKLVTALPGSVRSATELPTSIVLSTGFEKLGEIAVATGGFTDIWRGKYGGRQVAIKAFRIYPPQKLKEAKEVSAVTSKSEAVARALGFSRRVPRTPHQNMGVYRFPTRPGFHKCTSVRL